MSDGWDWELADRAHRELDALDDYAKQRIDDVVTDEWRDPPDFLEPLQGAPHRKLRIGPFRLGCRAVHDRQVLYVLRIQKRGGDAYRGDD